jgi:hypothetical protein
MKRALFATIAALIAAVSTPAAAAGVSLEGTIGSQRLGVTRAPGANEPLLAMGDYGATLLLRGGPLEVGFAAEGTFERGALARYNASALAGLGADVAMLRLEVLGELGVLNLRTRADLDQAAAGGDDFVRFYGVRPGLSAKLPLLPFRLGLWGLARWGLPGTRGPAYGMLGRVGIDF